MRALVAVLTLVLLAGVGFVGFSWWQDQRAKERTIEEQKRIIAALSQKLDRAWADELVADLRVESVDRDAQGQPRMRVRFVQYAPGSETPTLQKTMTLLGEELYVDALVVQFDRKFVDDGDGLRGKSLLLFRRAFGDRQRPIDGVPLFRDDEAAAQPSTPVDVAIPETVQVDTKPSEFERALWQRFWLLANDPKQAAEQGVRVAQGEAPHVRAVAGQVYKLTLRASGGLAIVPRLPAAMLGAAGDSGAP
ncbi:MAG: hypothetical protein NVSMB47_00960 [Polyangiales bacterium]